MCDPAALWLGGMALGMCPGPCLGHLMAHPNKCAKKLGFASAKSVEGWGEVAERATLSHGVCNTQRLYLTLSSPCLEFERAESQHELSLDWLQPRVPAILKIAYLKLKMSQFGCFNSQPPVWFSQPCPVSQCLLRGRVCVQGGADFMSFPCISPG
ncbi:coiled-coil-helix-coiled-coil-helix domain-containing protein 1-like [Platysternon megacephalum]|uniref:Coiled-coil-helix-coiled-coil-helix domain-containing protein 1-like n=1 Tax=Platysternon megacephalum TaxID=55544 RepID=A0A4D9EF23_9SAUR|nr:coiled-coil-helix-coiled-coil-helix domain-containing protein 1-like [Platysternon megacephalum]